MGMSATKSSPARAHGGWTGPCPSLNDLCLGTSNDDYIDLPSVWTQGFRNGSQTHGNTVFKNTLKAWPRCLRTNCSYFYLVIWEVHDQKPTKYLFFLYRAYMSKEGVEFKLNTSPSPFPSSQENHCISVCWPLIALWKTQNSWNTRWEHIPVCNPQHNRTFRTYNFLTQLSPFVVFFFKLFFL